MGNSLSDILTHKNSVKTPEMVEFTDEDIKHLTETWELASENPLDTGEAVLYRFFEKHPHYQDKFDAFRNTPLLSLKGTPGFRSHAGRIIRVFDNSVSALEENKDLDKLREIWTSVGSNHQKKTVPKQAFNDLREVVIEVLGSAFNLNETQAEVWNKLFDNVYHITFEQLDS